MGFYLTFYSVDKDTLPEPGTDIDGEGISFDYDDVFEEDAVIPTRIGSWKNMHELRDVLHRAECCDKDSLGPWVIRKQDISRILSWLSYHAGENPDDRWTDYEGLKLFLMMKKEAFDFDKNWLIFTAG